MTIIHTYICIHIYSCPKYKNNELNII